MTTVIISSLRRCLSLCVFLLFSCTTFLSAQTVSVNTSTASIAENAGGSIFFTISRTGSTANALTVNFSLAGTTTNGDDYGAISATSVTIPAGATNAEIIATPTNENLVETDETIIFNLENGSGYTVSPTNGSATTTITNDDDTEFSINDASITEGNDGETNDITFTVSLSNPVDRATSVQVATTAGTATGGGTDYNDLATTTLNFAANVQSQTFTVTAIGDIIVEADETFNATLTNALLMGGADANVTIGDDTGIGTITNDDQALLTIADAEIAEGNVGGTALTFTITSSATASEPMQVTVTTAAGTATEGVDYQALSTTATIAAGATTTTVDVTINGDLTAEDNETFSITLSSPQFNGTTASSRVDLGTMPSATGTILNDDSPNFSIDDVSQVEGDNGNTNMVFTVTLNPTATAVVTVDYDTENIEAIAGEDYTSTDGTLTFPIGTTSQTIEVPISGDRLLELDETFRVVLSNATGPNNPTINDGEGIGTIQNDDVVTVSINDVTQAETNSGTTTFDFTVSLDKITNDQVTVDVSSAAGTATAGDDYMDITPMTLTFAPLEDTKTVSVTVNGDAVVEDDETFTLTLANVAANGDSNPTIADAEGVGTIQNDDQSELSITDVSRTEGDNGTQTYAFVVTSTQATENSFTVDYTTTDGTATAGEDYVAAMGSLNFTGTAGETQTINVTVNGDEVVEKDELFTVVLSNVQASGLNVTIADDTGEGAIQNDDAATVSIETGQTVQEGASGTTTTVTLTVTLDAATSEAVSVDYTTMDDSATEANNDYETSAGTLTFAGMAGETKTFDIVINGDDVVEADEVLQAIISNLQANDQAVTLGNTTATVTIENDDNVSISIADATLTEGDNGTSDLTFNLTLSNAVDSEVTVVANTADDTAMAGSDYTAVSNQTITFAAGTTTQTLTVTITNEEVVELDEAFFVNLTNAAGASGITIEDDQAIGTIENDDAATLTIDNVTNPEGNSGTQTFDFTVTLSAATANAVTVDYATNDNSAVASDVTFDGNDYEMTSGTLNFAGTAGETQTISVTVNGDLVVEADEIFNVLLSNIQAMGLDVTFSDDTGAGTIENDDATEISINDVTANEGNAGDTDFTFTVSLNNSADHAITVDAVTATGSGDGATGGGDDYDDFSGTITFAPGVTEQIITIQVKGDEVVEKDENFVINLTNPTGSSNPTIADNQGVGTITNDDSATISIDDLTKNEGDAASDDFTYTITLSAAADRDVTIDAATTAGTATGGGTDYNDLASTTVTFAAGETTKTVTVTYVDDALVEGDEMFSVDLSNLQADGLAVTVDKVSGAGTIVDNDATQISIDDISMAEGNSGTQNYDFTISLSDAVQRPVTVDVTTTDGTATAGSDYVMNSGTVTFNAGETTKTFTVVVNGDVDVEDTETFTVDLTNARFDGMVDANRVTITDNSGLGTIINDDSPTVNIADASVSEDVNGSMISFAVTANPAAVSDIVVNYMTTVGTATGADFTEVASGSITLAPGETTKNIDITINNDNIVEADETFTLTITSVTGASNPTIGDGEATGTITNDDAAVLSVDNVSRNEADALTQTFDFTVSLSNPSDLPVNVTVTTSDNDATGSGTDYNNFTDNLTFAPGETTKMVSVSYINDEIVEADETFNLALSNFNNNGRTGVTQGDDGTGTITNDDVVTLTIDDVSQVEGNVGSTAFTFTVTADKLASLPITFRAATNDGPTNSATGNGVDYFSIDGNFTIPANQTSVTVTVNIVGETIEEPNETFVLDLDEPRFAGNPDAVRIIFGDNSGLGTIVNDDEQVFSISDAEVIEGNVGTATLSFTVTASSPIPTLSTVDFATMDGTATAGSDYVAQNGTLTFTTGMTEQMVNVTVNSDINFEQNENLFVNLTNPTSTNGTASISDNQGEGTILNDDSPNFSVADVSITEGDAGTQLLAFTVTLNSPGLAETMVDYTTGDDTAIAGEDYVAAVGTLTFPANTTSRVVNITINGDEKVELDQTFFFNLSNPQGAEMPTISDAQGIGTITNDDMATLSIDNVTMAEGAAGTTTDYTFTVTLDKELDNAATVDFNTADDTATDGSDYTGANGTLNFAGTAGETQTITVTVNGDDVAEADETFNTVLSNIQAMDLNIALNPANGTGVGTITNDDNVEISINDIMQSENMTDFMFTVSLNRAADSDITVDAATAANTATGGGTDFTDLTTTVTFAAGETEKMVTVTVNNDDIVEGDETFFVNLTNPTGTSNPTINDAQGEGTINDDDVAEITINDVSKNEGDAASDNFTFTVTLSKAADRDVSVSVATEAATATGGGTDYTDNTATLTFAAGETTKDFTVAYANDDIVEGDENFAVNVTNLMTNGLDDISITDGNGIGTIVDEDMTEISIADNSATEDNGSLVLTISLTKAASKAIMVTANTANGTTDNDDYVALNNQTATIPAGQTSTLLAVTLNDDDIVEQDETFTITISDPQLGGETSTAVTISDNEATGTITDNDMTEISIADATANEGDGTISFTVSLTNVATQDITVSANTADGTAESSDYTALTNETITIPAGQMSAMATVMITDDNLVEGAENFTITISDPQLGGATDSDVTISDATATGMIEDNDNVMVSISDATVAEENSPATFTITLSSAASKDVTVTVNTAAGTAGSADFTAVMNQTVTIPAGQTSATVDVTILDDNIVEADETFSAILSNPLFDGNSGSSVTIDDGTGTGTITNADATEISIADQTADEAAGTLNFVISLTNVASEDITVTANTANGTATAGSDYNAVSNQTVTIPAGQTMTTLMVTITDDMEVEAAEDFTATIADAQFNGTANANVSIADNMATGTITDNDNATVTIADVTVNEGAGTATFTATVDNAVSGGFTVEVSTVDGTAVAGADYDAVASQVLTFAGTAGETQTFSVAITDDNIVENNETFTVSMANVSNSNVDVSDTATGTIEDNDNAIVTIEDVNVNEVDGTATFTATVDKAVMGGFTVDVNTANGTATAGMDYTALTNQTLTFMGAAGEMRTFSVSITNDMTVESSETFSVSMTNASRTSIDITDTATGTIIDNDAASVIIADVSVNEGAGTATFTATLNQAVTGGFTVEVNTANGSATAGVDYVAVTNQTLTFVGTANETQTFTVMITDDAVVEANETFTVSMANVSNNSVNIADTATGTIEDNDNASVTIGNVSADEDAGTMTFTATLNTAVSGGFTVDLNTNNGSAVAGSDYNAVSAQTLTFAGTAGEQETFTVTILNNEIVEGDETFTIFMSNGSNASIDISDTATGTITNDDNAVISVNEQTASEAAGTMTFTITMDKAVDRSVSVNVGTADNSAVSNDDYTSFVQTLIFSAGETSKTITVSVNEDQIVELQEAFNVNLSNLNTGGRTVTLGSNGRGLITDNDAATISIDDVTQVEGNSGSTTFAFTVTLSAEVGSTVSMNFATVNGTATTGNDDYNSTNGALAFSSNGGLTRTVNVVVNGDDVAEDDETFTVALSNLNTNGLNVSFAKNNGTGTITNDDTALPLEWLSFYAKATKEQTVTLAWSTANELNVSHFEIEHSTDGLTFAAIGEVMTNGTTVYDFIDKTPVNGANYYRIRQLDNNGASTVSHVQLVRLEKVTTTLYPNPTQEVINLSYPTATDETVQINIVDARGQLLYRDNVNLANGQATLQLNELNVRESGVYHLVIQRAGAASETIQFVKMND